MCVCACGIMPYTSYDLSCGPLTQQWPDSTGLGFEPLQAEPMAPLRAASGWTPVVARLPKFQINVFSSDQMLNTVDVFLSYFVWFWYLTQIDLCVQNRTS